MSQQKSQLSEKQKAERRAAKEADFGRIDFVKSAPLMGGISLLLMIVSVGLILFKGLNYGIDFAGGTEIQIRLDRQVSSQEIEKAIVAAGIERPTIQSFSGTNDHVIRLGTPGGQTEKAVNDAINANVKKVRETLKTEFDLKDEGVLRVDTVGPAVGSELKTRGGLAAFYSFLVILIYVAIRFDYAYAPGAVICLIHDALLTIGVFALLNREFNVQIMAAVLTLIGYSLNDTIVTFDRIRETAPLNRDMSLKYIINKAINDMLGRTILTAATTMTACVLLFFFGGGVIAEIAFTLMIGIVVGTYSSIYVAAPLILVMDKLQKRQAAPVGQPVNA
jgi:preprotein translocase subunit SecF